MIQDGEAALFYRYSRELKGYFIAGVFIADTIADKIKFAKVWTYFVSKVVTKDDIYCSVMLGSKNSMFEKYLDYHSNVDGCDIYKVDNYLKQQYSSYDKHLEITSNGQ